MKHKLQPYAREINDALRGEMKRFQELSVEIFILGEDVCNPAGEDGAFKITSGLPEEFPGRVKNTILNESTIIGAGAGLAMCGARVVVEIQFADFVTDAYKMIVNYIAGIYYRNAIKLPMVIRLPSGATESAGAFHSTCPEMLFFREPGLLILSPATPYDAKGLLRSAIRQDTPVIFIEWKKLYGMTPKMYPEELNFEIPAKDYTVPIGKARTILIGSDLTVVSYGAMIYESLSACKTLGERGISCELIDLRSLMPFDHKAVLESVKKTGRLIVAHEDKKVGGFGAAFIQIMTQEFGMFDYLDAKPMVVGAKFTQHPHNPILEKEYLPNASDIVRTAEEMFGEAKVRKVTPDFSRQIEIAGSDLPRQSFAKGGPAIDGVTRVPFSPIQKVVAREMAENAERPTIPDHIDVDVTKIWQERENKKVEFEKEFETKLTLTHYFGYAVSRVLMQEELWVLRSEIEETTMPNGKIDWANPKSIIPKEFVNLSFAVDVPNKTSKPPKRELLAPVVRNIHKMSFAQIANTINDLAKRCRNKKILPDELHNSKRKDNEKHLNGNFNITNVGVFGTLAGNPILLTGQNASLAIGKINDWNGRKIVILSLTFDHRPINGSESGLFKQALKEYLENWNVDIFSA